MQIPESEVVEMSMFLAYTCASVHQDEEEGVLPEGEHASFLEDPMFWGRALLDVMDPNHAMCDAWQVVFSAMEVPGEGS